MSEASIGRLAQEAGQDVDGRRFRMLFTIDGCEPHEEDTWRGTLVRVGQAVVRVAVRVVLMASRHNANASLFARHRLPLKQFATTVMDRCLLRGIRIGSVNSHESLI